ncbi:MAG: GCAxxG family protein [Deltaproteobacteria bacterium]|nr:GCAxxG family protein [Deltaproteobacteria bacterium]
MKKMERIAEAKTKARKFFQDKRANCAESVFKAIHEMVANDLPVQVSALFTPLGGGVGIRGENCGAMLAGVMALGLVHGRFDPARGSLEEHRKHLWDTYSLYNQLPQRFIEKYGSLQCWDLTKPHIYGTKKCRDFCEDLIAETAGIVMRLLIDAEEKGLRFSFHRNLLSQAAEFTGLPAEELIRLKEKGEPFPVPNCGLQISE